MRTIAKLLLITILAVQSLSAADKNLTRQDVERMLSKKGSYEFNLVGRRLLRPIDDALLKRLVANPDESAKHDYILSRWLLRIAAESNRQYLWLLESKELTIAEEAGDILLAYDYNVNGNKKALETLLARVRKSVEEGHSWGSARTYAMGAVNEWDLCRQALGSRLMSADGSGSDERYGFWLTRRYFFPEGKEFPGDYEVFCRDLEQLQAKAEQASAGQPATASESKPKGGGNPKPESEPASR